MVFKTCTNCKEEKDINKFSKKKTSKDGYRTMCKNCSNNKKKIYTKNNHEKVLTAYKKYYINNKKTIYNNKKNNFDRDKIKINERRRNFRKNNKELVNSRERAYENRDELTKLKVHLRKSIGNTFKRKNLTKSNKTTEILGLSIEQFKQYIESQFKQGMSWENRGDWHIDHIIPISFAENEEEVIMLNHYTNLRPLWKVENLSKNDNILEKTDLYHEIIKIRSLTLK